jgi:hypothetical protein
MNPPITSLRRRAPRVLALIALLASFGLAFLPSTPLQAGEEEFAGPFPSWRDLRRDYGARGDGQTDDTPALQRALDDLTRHTNHSVLYLPAGSYRLTSTVKTVRKAHTDGMGVSVIGESPETTVLRWGGTNGGQMFRWDAWYSKISRLQLDGAGRAAAALYYGPAFSTYNETSDMIFRDCGVGLQFGDAKSAGQAENAVLRCQFLRCTNAGVLTVNWNSMDIWLWHCRFEDCGRGVHNVMGNYHVWESHFLRSRVADVSIQNLMVFSVVNNFSYGSRCFLDFDTGHSWGSPASITGNRIVDWKGDFALKLGNAGPYLVMGNQFKSAADATNRAARMTWGDQTFAGNTYTATNAVLERGRSRRLAERYASPLTPSLPPAPLPTAPLRRERRVIEVALGANAAAIQQAITEAARTAGQRPIVHLPMGVYTVTSTIVVPRGCDVQLVGDGGAETATRLNWAGPSNGPVIRLEGPSHATLSDFYIHAPRARALLVEDADQPGGRIFADELNVSGPSGAAGAAAAALRVHGLVHTDVLLRCLQGSGNGGKWVEVVGTASSAQSLAAAPPGLAPAQPTNQVSIFTGATGSAAGQYDVKQGGQLVVRSVYHERSADSLCGIQLTGTGNLAIDATRFSYATSAKAPTVAAHDFAGLFTLATCLLMPVETTNTCRFELSGDGSRASVLSLANQFWILEPGVTSEKVWLNRAVPPAHGGLVGCNMNSPVKGLLTNGFAFLENTAESADIARSPQGSGPLPDRNNVDDATLLKHLAPLRQARVWTPGPTPAGATDLLIHRVMADGGSDATVEIQAETPASGR